MPVPTVVVPANTWWSQYKKDPHIGAAVITAVNQVQDATLGLQTRFNWAANAFGGHGYMASGRFSSAAAGGVRAGQRNGPRDNIIYSVISTVCSQLLDDGAPGVRFLTSHGDWEIQHRAEMLEQFTDGLFYQVGFDAESSDVLQDACIFGTGFMKYFVDADNTIHAERVFPAEIMVDIWDGRDRKPRTLYQVGFIDRDLLATRYGAHDKKLFKSIMEVRPQMPTGFTSVSATATNIIPFIEAWHLPTSAEAGDGRHVLTLANDLTILDDEYLEDDFPFSVLRFEIAPTGYHGIGIAELLAGHQKCLNDANTAEYWAWSQVGTPRLWFQTGTLDKNHLNSSLSGLILEGQGQPPQVLNWSATHPSFVEWKNDIKAGAFNLIGTSPLTASGVKPPGLNSGESQRVYADQQHSRRAILSQRWQEFRCDAARKCIALARHVYTEAGAFSVKVVGKNFIKKIDFKDADLPEDEYRMQALPVSQLPKSVGGRLQTVTEMLQAQLIDPDTGRKLLNMPDIDEAMDEANAAYDNAQHTAYLLLNEGEAPPPDGSIQDLAQCKKAVTAATLRGMDNKAPPENIAAALAWLVQCRAAITKATAPPPGATPPGAPPGPGQPMPGPMAQGAPPPVSSVLPFKAPGR